MNILQKIISDNIENIEALNIRPVISKNINKIVHCGDPSYGGALFECPECNHMKFVPFRCHSRFCPSCGTNYAMERTSDISFKLIKCSHRHCVFTIDESLRIFFRRDRSCLNLLFKAVRSVILRMFSKINKSKSFTPSFVAVLHTFGRDLKWNPHIHCIITEGEISNDGIWRRVSHFPFKFLRNAFQTALLNLLEKHFDSCFRFIKAACYKNHKNGFYVYAKFKKCNLIEVTKYIGRYLGRPAIATSRIDKYENSMVTFHYNRHEDEKLIIETIPVMNFIKRLIIHIPGENFKQIRYYGIYARQREIDKILKPAISKEQQNYMRSLESWRCRIMVSFGYDPLSCPHCRTSMKMIALYHEHHNIPFVECYLKEKRGFNSNWKNPSPLVNI